MPAIRSQTVNAGGVTIVTQAYGTLEVTVTTVGNTTTVRVFRDGLQIQQASLQNATPAGLELAINGLVNPPALNGVGLVGFAMHILTHVFAVNPFSAAWISSDPTPPPNWWQ